MRGILGCAMALLVPALLGATTCIVRTPCRLLRPGGVAFIGDIVSAEKAEPEYSGYRHRHHVRIVEAIYGLPPEQTSLDVFSYNGGESGGRWKPGRYLFAGVPRERGLTLGLCDGPKPIRKAAADIRYLRDSLRNRRHSSIDFRVFVAGRSAAGTMVMLDSDSQRFRHLVSDPDEEILFDRLEPGPHRVSVYLQASKRNSGATELEVPPGSCLVEYAKLVPRNSLAGTVLDINGKPVPGVPVSYRLRGSPPDSWPPAVRTSTEGAFEVRGIPPGQYDLAACAGLAEEPGACAPSAFPANPVTVNLDSHITCLRLAAGRALTTRTLRIRLDKEMFAAGELSSFHADKQDWLQMRRIFSRRNPFDYAIPKELTTRIVFVAPFRKELVIPPGENDVEIRLP